MVWSSAFLSVFHVAHTWVSASTKNIDEVNTNTNYTMTITTASGSGTTLQSLDWTVSIPLLPTTLATSTSSTENANTTNAYQSAILYNHNIHRSNHSANALSWCDILEASALKLAQQCVYRHNTSIDGGGYGQNIGYGVSSQNIGKMITNLMYNNEAAFFNPLYGQPQPNMNQFESWGHFSQIVWKKTEKVGCATVFCNNLGNAGSSNPEPFTVCNYSPAGNYDGQYTENVLAPLGYPVYTVL